MGTMGAIGAIEGKNSVLEVIKEELTNIQKKSEQSEREFSIPIEALPKIIQEIVLKYYEVLNFIPDYSVGSILFATSVSIGSNVNIEVKDHYITKANLWFALVGSSGLNKTAPLYEFIRPLLDIDKMEYRNYKQKVQEYKIKLEEQKRRKKGEPYEYIEKPVYRQMLVGDTTTEALASVLENNPLGVGLYSDELRNWFGNFNRYNRGDDESFYNSLYDNIPITINRKNDEPKNIPNPFLSICGTIQPGVLDYLASGKKDLSGFTIRFCYLYPENAKAKPLPVNEFDLDYLNQWNIILQDIINQYRTNNIITFTLSNEAYEMFSQWNIDKTNRINTTDDETIKTIYSKSEKQLIRLALILEVLNRACLEYSNTSDCNNMLISAKSMSGAIKLTEYFINTSIRVHEIATNSNPLAKYPLNVQNFIEALPEYFETKTAVSIGSEFNIPERTVKNYLRDKNIFRRIERGQYEKL
jgi:hypothetical protein